MRRSRLRIAGAFALFGVLVGALALLGTAYALQADKVDDLEAQNDRILSDHKAIGAAFSKQSRKVAETSRRLDKAVRQSYDNGFVAGQQALTIPLPLRPLARQAASGMLVPRKLPQGVGSRKPTLEADLASYTIRWRQLALFASKLDSLRTWTRQALGGTEAVAIGRHHVRRLLGPSGVIYAWREQGTTYATLASARLDTAARSLIASMR